MSPFHSPMKTKRVIITSAAGVQRYLRCVGPNEAKWTFHKSGATQFDLQKMDKAVVGHFEKCLGCPITLLPV